MIITSAKRLGGTSSPGRTPSPMVFGYPRLFYKLLALILYLQGIIIIIIMTVVILMVSILFKEAPYSGFFWDTRRVFLNGSSLITGLI